MDFTFTSSRRQRQKLRMPTDSSPSVPVKPILPKLKVFEPLSLSNQNVSLPFGTNSSQATEPSPIKSIEIPSVFRSPLKPIQLLSPEESNLQRQQFNFHQRASSDFSLTLQTQQQLVKQQQSLKQQNEINLPVKAERSLSVSYNSVQNWLHNTPKQQPQQL